MLKSSFQTIGLIIRQASAGQQKEIMTICKSLANYGDLLIHYLDEQFVLQDYPLASLQQISSQADLAVSVGGDGTLLTVARYLVDHDIPIVGINLGRLGFLADVTMAELDTYLAGLFAGNYSAEKRFLIQGEIQKPGQQAQTHIALNDIILHGHQSISMLEFEVFSGGDQINKQRADGLIVTTPTGSTAYALSGGGPIMHPSMNTLALVPICPHTLSNRPIVLPADQHIEIRLSQPDMVGQLSFDGLAQAVIQHGDNVVIKRYQREITLIHPADYDYFHILRAKLKWSNQP